MSAVFGITPDRRPAMLSDTELNDLLGEIMRNQPMGYFERLKHPDFIPVGEVEKYHHTVVTIMKRRGLI